MAASNIRRERNYPVAPAFEYFVVYHQAEFSDAIIAGFINIEDAWNFAEECEMANGNGQSYSVINKFNELQARS